MTLDDMVQWRNQAHYDLSPHRRFSSSAHAHTAIQRSADTIALLDAIEADPARLAQAIAALKP
jgi:hypothetical protein